MEVGNLVSLETSGAATAVFAMPHVAGDEPAVVLEMVCRRFGAKVALDEVSLTLDRGEIHALLGPNGAGKTTLLRILSGLLLPTSGSVSVLGARPERQSRALRGLVGLVPSGDRSLYLRISGLENLIFFGRLHGLRRGEAKARALELLEHVGLTEAARLRAGVYSHGMRRRLALARALLARPPVLLFDEATHDLDPEGARSIRRLVEAAAGHGAAVVWATQRLEEIHGFAGRATVLAGGRVRFGGAVPELLDRVVPRRYVLRLRDRETRAVPPPARVGAAIDSFGRVESIPGAPEHLLVVLHTEAVLGAALAAVAAEGLETISCTQERSELEEAFLSLTGERR